MGDRYFFVGERAEDPMTGAGWTTLTPGGGQTAAWGSGKLTLTSPAGVNAGGECGVHKDLLTSGEEYDIAIRVDVIDATSAAANCNLALTVGNSLNDRLYWQLFFDGSWQAGGFAGGGWVTHLSRTGVELTGGQLAGGNLWMRIQVRSGWISFLWGVGTAGAAPTTWTRRAKIPVSATTLVQSLGGLRVGVEVDTGGTPGTDVVVEALAIRTVERGSAL